MMLLLDNDCVTLSASDDFSSGSPKSSHLRRYHPRGISQLVGPLVGISRHCSPLAGQGWHEDSPQRPQWLSS